MATIAPWLKGPDVLEAMQKGAGVGLKRRQLREEARANTLRHMAAMAGIRANAANAAQRNKLAQQASEQRQAQAAQDLLMQQAGLEQRSELAQLKAATDLAQANRPRYMNVEGGLAQIGPQGDPTFIDNPLADAGRDVDELLADDGSGAGTPGAPQPWEVAGGAVSNAMRMLGGTTGSPSRTGRKPRNKMTMGGNDDPLLLFQK
jgi:hypothetical protein